MQVIAEKELLKSHDDNSVMIYLLNEADSDNNMLGITMSEWVKRAITKLSYIEIKYDGGDLIKFIKPYLVNSKYSLILFSSTPLLTEPSVLKIMEYATMKRVNACKFNGGFIFNTNYLLNAKEVFFDAFLPLDSDDFLVVKNKSTMSKALKILQTRIIDKFVANGTIIKNAVVEANVEIGQKCMIFDGNVLKGNTIIGNNVILKENNVIENSYIGDDSCVSSSNICDSKVEDNVFILPYSFVNKSTIRKNCYLSSQSVVENRTLRAGTRLNKENK